MRKGKSGGTRLPPASKRLLKHLGLGARIIGLRKYPLPWRYELHWDSGTRASITSLNESEVLRMVTQGLLEAKGEPTLDWYELQGSIKGRRSLRSGWLVEPLDQLAFLETKPTVRPTRMDVNA